MSRRIHGNHHQHMHPKHKLEEHAWIKHLQDKGFIVQESPGHHEKHKSFQERYQVFRILDDVKELVIIDDYGDMVSEEKDVDVVAGFPPEEIG